MSSRHRKGYSPADPRLLACAGFGGGIRVDVTHASPWLMFEFIEIRLTCIYILHIKCNAGIDTDPPNRDRDDLPTATSSR
jgi:hypothetical protein